VYAIVNAEFDCYSRWNEICIRCICIVHCWLVDVDEDDEEDDEDAEEGYDEIVAQDKNYVRDEGPSARDIEGLLRAKDMWRCVSYSFYFCACGSVHFAFTTFSL